MLVVLNITQGIFKSDLSYGGKLYMALNSCPSFYERLYMKAIYGPKFRIATLALNIVKKAKADFKVKAQKIFAKICTVLGFKNIFHKHEGDENILYSYHFVLLEKNFLVSRQMNLTYLFAIFSNQYCTMTNFAMRQIFKN